jgi:hypothetical protein
MPATFDALPLSLTQRYFHDIILAEGFDPTWQHVTLTINSSPLEPGRVHETVARLAIRHPLIATRLEYREGGPVLRPVTADGVAVCLDLRDASPSEFEQQLMHAHEAPFDILGGPMWRIIAARGPHGTHTLSFVGHHLVADAVSSWILCRDFGDVHFDGEIEPCTEPYETFAAEQHAMDEDPPADRIEYWESYLEGAEPLIEGARPSTEELSAGASLPLRTAPFPSPRVLERARTLRVTPLALVTGATMSGIREATGQQDLTCAAVTDVRGARFAKTVGTFSELMFVRERDGAAGMLERLRALRDGGFNGWRRHLPMTLLRDRLDCFGGDRRGLSPNPCDIFQNFVAIGTANDFLTLNPGLANLRTDFRPTGHSAPAPTHRMLGPRFFLTYVLERVTHGSIAVRRGDGAAALNEAVLDAVSRDFAELSVPLEPLGASPSSTGGESR